MMVIDYFGVLALRRDSILRFATRGALRYATVLALVAATIRFGMVQPASLERTSAAALRDVKAFVLLCGAAMVVAYARGRRGERFPAATVGMAACACVVEPLGQVLQLGAPHGYAAGAVAAIGVRAAIAWSWRALVLARAIVVLYGVRGLVAWTCFLAPASAAYGILTFYTHYGQTRGVFGPRTSLEAEHLAFGYGAAIVFSLVIPIAIGMATAVHILLRDDPAPGAAAADPPPPPAPDPPPAGPAETACAPEDSR